MAVISPKKIAVKKSVPIQECHESLVDLATGKELDMGTAVDAFAIDLIYMWHPDLSKEAQENRVLLYTAMDAAGFTNLPIEWWHYSYGDQEYAFLSGAPCAVYDTVQKIALV